MIRAIHEFFSQLAEETLTSSDAVIALEELTGASVYFWLLKLSESFERTIFFVTENNETAQEACAYFETAAETLSGEPQNNPLKASRPRGLFYPEIEPTNLFEYPGISHELKELQLKVQQELVSGKKLVVFCPYTALHRRTFGRKIVEKSHLCLRAKYSGTPSHDDAISEIEIDELCKELIAYGYENTSIVTKKGEFARRGGILDIFPFGSYFPVRLDFYGNEIEEIKSLDPATQRSIQKVDEVTILPKSQLHLLGGSKWVVEVIRDYLHRYEREMGGRFASSALQTLKNTVEEDLAAIEEERATPRADFYAEIVGMSDETIVHFTEKPMVVFYEPLLIENEIASYKKFWESRFSEWRENGLSFTSFADYYLPFERFTSREVFEGKRESHYEPVKEEGTPSQIHCYTLRAPQDSPIPRRQAGCQHIPLSPYTTSNLAKTIKTEKGSFIIVSQFAERIKELVHEGGAEAMVLRGSLPRGFAFVWKNNRTILITDLEIFGEITEAVTREQRVWRKGALKTTSELSPGDYVVHIDYGIGKFIGLTEREVKGVKRVYVEIAYAENEKLFLPVDQLDRLKVYRASGTPKLSSLSRSGWSRVKQKAKKDVFEFALKLFKLYRQRKTETGYKFQGSRKWMEEFIKGFPYELTPDQRDAWEAVERDMESPKVMDRLVCGEVGFGKTEIALRAAFKACLSNKQALMLCPTTILAEQHYMTFLKRFRPFPFRVEMLSRFQSHKSQQDIVDSINEGKVDVVIATHRALSKDINFPRLGLLIIDEEQRFGVRQKEALKIKYRNIDVLTLTATPIPRTLRMSLMDLMDISLIETPPPERKPVRTYVGEWNEHLIKDAILKELSRGGQVYYLHNRIRDIGGVSKWLKELVPGIRVGIAHGELPEKTLEEMMLAFNMGAFDVLLATTIIENGLDIPRVNTLIVDAAENLGLAQMHQIRGRVGRSRVSACAFFFHSPVKLLTPEAKERLKAIYSCAYLGAGYEIAQLDMLIRGAGTILGTEQSGTIEAIGMDYYFDLLQSAVENLRELPEEFIDKGEIYWPEDTLSVQVDLPLACFIPESYIKSTPLRMELYRRIASARNEKELFETKQELVDRFGALPPEAQNLFYIIEVKQLARQAKISQVSYIPAQEKLILLFANSEPSPPQNETEASSLRLESDKFGTGRGKKIPSYSSRAGQRKKENEAGPILERRAWLRKLQLLDSRVTEVSDAHVAARIPYGRDRMEQFKDDVETTISRIIALSNEANRLSPPARI